MGGIKSWGDFWVTVFLGNEISPYEGFDGDELLVTGENDGIVQDEVEVVLFVGEVVGVVGV